MIPDAPDDNDVTPAETRAATFRIVRAQVAGDGSGARRGKTEAY